MKKNLIFLFIILLIGNLLKSQTWTPITVPPSTGVEHLAVAGNKLYLASSYGIYKSADGISWDTSSTGMTFFSGFTFSKSIYNYNGILYAGGMGKIYKSVDFGVNWSNIQGSAPSVAAINSAILVSGDTIFTGWASGKGMYSTKNGINWYQGSGAGVSGRTIEKNIVYYNGNIYIKTYTGVLKSTDKGVTYTQLSGGLPAISGQVGAIVESNGVLICSIYTMGLYISSDEGVTWTQINSSNGLTTLYGATLNVINNTVYLGCTTGKVFKSKDHGMNWTDITGTGINSLDQIKGFAEHNGYLYAGGTYGLYRTGISTSVYNYQKDNNSLEIYPNPTGNLIYLKAKEDLNISTISIINEIGMVIIEKVIDVPFNEINIDISMLSQGVYFVQITNKEKLSIIKKFIKK